MAAMTWPRASGGANQPGKALRSASIVTSQGDKAKGGEKRVFGGPERSGAYANPDAHTRISVAARAAPDLDGHGNSRVAQVADRGLFVLFWRGTGGPPASALIGIGTLAVEPRAKKEPADRGTMRALKWPARFRSAGHSSDDSQTAVPRLSTRSRIRHAAHRVSAAAPAMSANPMGATDQPLYLSGTSATCHAFGWVEMLPPADGGDWKMAQLCYFSRVLDPRRNHA